MIEQITVGQTLLQLKKPLQGEAWQSANLFSFDSLSLLIGANGAGKTSFLRGTAWCFHSGSETDSAKAKLSLSENEQADGVRNYGVVYYTPIPYPVDLPKSTRNFINATPEYGNRKNDPVVDLEHYRRVGESLGFNVRPLAVMSFDLVDAVTRIGRSILEGMSHTPRGRRNSSELPWLPEFMRDGKEYPASLARFLSKATVAYFLGFEEALPSERKISSRLESLGRHYITALLHFVESRLGELRVPLLSALEDTIEEEKVVGEVVSIFLGRYLLDDSFERQGNSYYSRANGLGERLSLSVEAKQNFFLAHDQWADYANEYRVGAYFEITDSQLLQAYARGTTRSEVNIVWEKFSSGQLALLYQFSAINRAAEELRSKGYSRLLVLIDEGDIYLHAAWQRRYVELLDDSMKGLENSFKSVQVVLTSHSSTLLTDVPKDCVLRMGTGGKESHRSLKTFAAPLEDIVNNSFETGSLGSFAQKKIKATIENLREGHVSDTDRYVIEMIDDPILKRELQRMASN